MTSGEQDAEFFRERGFGLKIGFGARPALIVIDMIKAFTDPAMMLGSNLDRQIEAIQPLLAAAHEREIPVIFSTVMYHEADLGTPGSGRSSRKASSPSRPGPTWLTSILASTSGQATACW